MCDSSESLRIEGKTEDYNSVVRGYFLSTMKLAMQVKAFVLRKVRIRAAPSGLPEDLTTIGVRAHGPQLSEPSMPAAHSGRNTASSTQKNRRG